MPGVYTLKVLTEFASAHTLTHYPGACARMHGHNWKVELEVRATQLDEIGIAIDFKTMKREANRVCDELDHRYLNEIPPFNQINPTAENLAAYLYRRLADTLNSKFVSVSAITLWETDRACVRYTEDTPS